MELGIKDKVALVLASSKGLGKAVAMQLAKEGANVIISGTDVQALLATESELNLLVPGNVFSIECDLTKEDDRSRLVKQSIERFGRIDILVTNTGGPPAGGVDKFNLSDWKDLYNLLFLSAVDVIQQVIPSMKERHWGRILTITSITVKQPVDNLLSSNSVRTALLGFAKSLSNELAVHGITVNNILPGYTETNRLKQLMGCNPNLSKVIESIPMKRFGTVEEFAAVAAFLVSERASYVTGQSLAVDGGWIKGN